MKDKDLKQMEQKLLKAKELAKSLVMKELEIKDSELIKFNSHGQWSINRAAGASVNESDRPEK